jgi:DNA polymerase-3 subunit delta
VTIFLITGGDARLVSAKLTDLTAQLIGDGDRNTMFESHDLETGSVDERELAIAGAVKGAQTSSLFGDERMIVIRGIHEATVNQLAPLLAYLLEPIESNHLIVTATGKLAKSITDALKKAGATTFSTSPPSNKSDIVTWFQEHLTEAGLKLDPGALSAAVNWLGQDQARLPSLIEVLISTYGTSKKLTTLEIEPFLGERGSVLPWDLTDAIDKSNAANAIAMLHRMLGSGEYHPLQVMALLNSHYTKLLRLDGFESLTQQDALVRIGTKSNFQAQKYLDTSRKMGSKNIASAISLLARADIDLRGGKDLSEELTMEILVARLCRMGGQAQLPTRRR